MPETVDWDDVATFVAAYMDRRRREPVDVGHTSLLDEMTDAYLACRSLPESKRTEVIAMVDSVL